MDMSGKLLTVGDCRDKAAESVRLAEASSDPKAQEIFVEPPVLG